MNHPDIDGVKGARESYMDRMRARLDGMTEAEIDALCEALAALETTSGTVL